MKILNIHFKNINSLEGESRIDFEASPLSDSGVFAITGPNGSGKSSVLDAITLGLYGETFRFDRPANFVMTKHTAESFAEVEFSVDGQRYRSSWRAERVDLVPEGELQTPVMQLVRVSNGEVLGTTVQQVCVRVTELTGMNFRNFTRSILLAQGDFAAFLNALDSERMDILEKIIGIDIYDEYKKEVTANADAAQLAVAKLKQELAMLTLVDPAQLEAYQHDLSDFQEQYSEWRQTQKDLEQQHVSLRKTVNLQNLVKDQEKILGRVNADFQKVNDTLQQLSAAQPALAFQEPLAACDAQSAVITQSKHVLTDYRQELQQLKYQLGNDSTAPANIDRKSFTQQKRNIDVFRTEVSELTATRQSEMVLWQSLGNQIVEKKEALALVQTWLDEHAVDQILLDNFPETARLKKLRTEILALTAQQKSLVKSAKHSTGSLKNMTSAQNRAAAKSVELKEQLQADEQEIAKLLQGYNAETISDLKAHQQERVKELQELNNIAVAYKKLSNTSSGWLGLFGGKAVLELDANELAQDLENLMQEIKREENIKLALEESVARAALLKKMAPERVHLVDGKPCPLCGALQHPYHKRPPVVANSQQALADQLTKIKSLKADAQRLKQRIIAAEKNQDHNRDRLNRMQQLRSRWLSLINRLNIAGNEMEINQLKLMRQLLQQESNELKNIAVLAKKYHDKKANIEKLTHAIADNVALVEQLKIDSQKFEADNQHHTQDQLDNEAALAACIQQEQELAKVVLSQLAALGEKMPEKGKEDALFDRLNARRQEYQSYVVRHKSLNDEIASMEAKQESCQAEIARCDEQLERSSGQLQNAELVGIHLAIIEKQRLIVDQEVVVATQEAELFALQQTLVETLQPMSFNDIPALRAALDFLKSQPEIEQRSGQLAEEIAAKTAELEQNRALLSSSLSEDEAKSQLESVYLQLHQLAEKMDIAKLEIQRLEKLIAQQQKAQESYAALLVRIEQEEASAAPFLAELEEVNVENGITFRRRVQTRLANKLLAQTNAVLEKISRRYYLRQAPSEQGLALEIEDTFQGNVRRLPKTLSGGESFIVSLALALGLSELANNGKSVDSLFLDEGFGNLDDASLFTVISTLESLQTHGKIVGVISHVDAVKKRFKAQIEVVKKPNGLGELKKAS